MVCDLRRGDFHTDPGAPDHGTVHIRRVNKKTRARTNWMCTWLEDVFAKREMRLPDRNIGCGKR
eukprot:3545592-Amphidinium_carterae.1